jgi:hypothetical protein
MRSEIKNDCEGDSRVDGGAAAAATAEAAEALF